MGMEIPTRGRGGMHHRLPQSFKEKRQVCVNLEKMFCIEATVEFGGAMQTLGKQVMGKKLNFIEHAKYSFYWVNW